MLDNERLEQLVAILLDRITLLEVTLKEREQDLSWFAERLSNCSEENKGV